MMLLQKRSRSASIVIRVGSESRRMAPPRDALTRVGSHVSCELRLSDAHAPPHLATIERRGGELHLRNSSSQVMRVGGDELPAGSSRPWRRGEEARLNHWVSMILTDPEVEARSARPRLGQEAATEPPAQPGGARDVLYVLLCGLSLVLAVWLLVADGPTDSRTTDAFSRLARADDGATVHARVFVHLRQSRAEGLRGEPSKAAAELAAARDALLRLRRPDGSFPDAWSGEAFDYVRQALGSR